MNNVIQGGRRGGGGEEIKEIEMERRCCRRVNVEAGEGGKKWNREGEEVGIGGWEGGGNRGMGRRWEWGDGENVGKK